MAAFSLLINNQSHTVEVSPETPLLWVLRDALKLTGTKYECGMGLCGACTVAQVVVREDKEFQTWWPRRGQASKAVAPTA